VEDEALSVTGAKRHSFYANINTTNNMFVHMANFITSHHITL